MIVGRRFIVLLMEIILLIGILGIVEVSGQVSSFASSAVSQPQASFQAVYTPEDRLNKYWPILGDKETCQARQDLMLQISPAGCQPLVVRSDLLADQNVPVFCQIDALQINPLIDITQIRSISFSGKYPKEIIGAGFYPAQAALRSRDKLLGSPLINNIGYIVVVLKRNEKEKELPDFVNVTLTGRIDYEAGNAYGVGKAEFALAPMSDAEWGEDKFKQSFWNGRYFVRLDGADADYAIVSLYSGERKIATEKVKKGEIGRIVWVPGAYCRAGVKVAYDGYVGDKNRALIEIGSREGSDRIEVFEGSRIINDKCTISKISVSGKDAGSVSIDCGGKAKLVLSLGEANRTNYTGLYLEESYTKDKVIQIFLDEKKSKNSNIRIVEGLVSAQGSSGMRNIGKVDDKEEISIDKGNFDLAVKELNIDGNLYNSLNGAKIEGSKIIPKTSGENKGKEKDLGAEMNKKFDDAIAELEKVADEYPAEREKDVEGGKIYGQEALVRAINLAKESGKLETEARLKKKFLEIYSDSELSAGYRYELNQMDRSDFSKAGGVVELDSKYWNVRLIGVEKPSKKSNAEFSIGGIAQDISIEAEGEKDVPGSKDDLVKIKLEKIIDEQSVMIIPSCKKDNKINAGSSVTLKKGADATKICGKSNVKLNSVNLEQIAKIRLIPEAQGTETITNLSVNIGIEKRAIKLSPDKTGEMIKNLNESIKKWENINEKLGKIVTGLKGACFATAGVLTVKNFLTGLSGEALARQKIMSGEKGWTRQCADEVSRGVEGSPTLNACYLKHRDEISKDVAESEKLINDINGKIDKIEKPHTTSGGGTLGLGKSVDRSKSAVDYCKDLLDRYPNEKIETSQGSKSLKEIVGDCQTGYDNGVYGYNELRDIEYNLRMGQSGASVWIKNNSGIALKSSYNNIIQNKQRYDDVIRAKQMNSKGIPSPIISTSNVMKNVVGQVSPASGLASEVVTGGVKSEYVAAVNVYDTTADTGVKEIKNGFKDGNYLLGVKKDSEGFYNVQEVFQDDGKGNYVKIDDEKRVSEFTRIYGIGRVTAADTLKYNYQYKNPEVRFYETEPYKGMPAIVPFDTRAGWYAATRQTLPAFGGIGSFDASGRVTSFYLCNVGENGKEQFFEGQGDDICQLINLNTGQPLGVFPGLDEREAKMRVGQAVQAIEEASRQYGGGKKSVVTIGGKDYFVGNPAANIPTTQCQNFMSPEECYLMFNVCDPVICPPSRCDFGGQYPVADVVQTGIIGSTLLCLPNIREKIVVPVCLTGIHAGVEGYLSIMKNHRDCLQESLKDGKMIGICDEIYSIYSCEFFWRQLAPVAKVILPKIIELAYGGGARGGGEYLTVGAAWQNMQNSINYFTQSYAANSIKAFQARTIEEAGTPICKAFVSAKAPTAFKSLIEPDSPPQFHAWFSSIRYTDATVPATSQYKVFYHIFAGKDQGVQYSVYLKNPPESSYYTMPSVIQVAYGFVGRGQYASQTRDFTAPEGYKELCVRANDKEECGFKEVSTSFAVNYLSDSYAKSEIENKNIKTEKECISGSANLGAVLTTPNLQAGAEEALIPKNYERGIVRICSSQNPGSQTDVTRFAEVGYCDEQKMKCWLDKKSVENAISDNNKGLKNATLSSIESTQMADLKQKGIIVADDAAVAGIKLIDKDIAKLKDKSVDAAAAEKGSVEILQRIDDLFGRVVLNHYKANLLYLKGDLKAVLAEKIVKKAGSDASVIAATGKASEIVGEARSSDTEGKGAITSQIIFLVNKEEKNTAKAGNKVEVKIEHTCEVEYKVRFVTSDGKANEYVAKLAKDTNIFSLNNLGIGEYAVLAKCAGENSYTMWAKLNVS